MSSRQIKVLFVCTGNICRSPTAEAVFRHLIADAGLAHCIGTDSAGTHGYHINEAPDPRTQRVAASRGYDLAALRGVGAISTTSTTCSPWMRQICGRCKNFARHSTRTSYSSL